MAEENEDNIDIFEIPSLTKGKSEIFNLIDLALERGASDLILSMGSNPAIRVDGK